MQVEALVLNARAREHLDRSDVNSEIDLAREAVRHDPSCGNRSIRWHCCLTACRVTATLLCATARI